jgi:hypothetical protein
MKARNYVLLASALLLALTGFATTLASAQYACNAQISYPATATTQYSGSYYNGWYIRLNVPVTAACSVSQLYAVGNVYDPVMYANVATTSTTMSPNNGGAYTGLLTFNLPPSVVEHPLQISVVFYTNNANGYYTSQVASTSFTATIHASPTYMYNGYPYGYYYYPSYQYYGYYPRTCTYQYYGYCPYYPSNSYSNPANGPAVQSNCSYSGSQYSNWYYYNGVWYYAKCTMDRR